MEIGISEPAIYRHFESKMSILVAIHIFFSSENKRFFSKVLLDETTVLEKITQIMEHHFTSFSAKPALAAVIFSEEIFQNEQRLADMVLEIMNQSRAAITTVYRKRADEFQYQIGYSSKRSGYHHYGFVASDCKNMASEQMYIQSD